MPSRRVPIASPASAGCASALLSTVLHLLVAGSPAISAAGSAAAPVPVLPVQRHVGRWSAPPHRIPTARMFDSPIVGNGDAGITFGGPPSQTTFYASSNSFWSANSVVDARPDFSEKPGGAESYTQVRIGDWSLEVPALASNSSYAAVQDLWRATVNATYSNPHCTLSHETFIARDTEDDNLAVTTLTASGSECGTATLTLRSGYLAGKYGPTHAGVNQSSRTLLISRDSVTTRFNKLTAAPCFVSGQQINSQNWSVSWQDMTSPSSTPNGSLALVDGRCIKLATQHAGEPSLTIGDCVDDGSGSVGSGWHLAHAGPGLPTPPPVPPGPAPVPPPPLNGYIAMPGYVGGQHGQPPTHVPGNPIMFHCSNNSGPEAQCLHEAAAACTAAGANCTSFGMYWEPSKSWSIELFTAPQTKGSFLDAGWTSWRKQSAEGPPAPAPPPPQPAGLVLTDVSGQCAGLDGNGEFLQSESCASATRWGYDLESGHLYSLAVGDHKWGGGRCLTAVEPNPLVAAAMALRVVDSDGQPIALSGTPVTDGNRTSSMNISLDGLAGKAIRILTAIITQGNCTGCKPDVQDIESAAELLVNTRSQDVQAVVSSHQAWWKEYWQAGAKIDLGPQWQRLEGFYVSASMCPFRRRSDSVAHQACWVVAHVLPLCSMGCSTRLGAHLVPIALPLGYGGRKSKSKIKLLS